MNQKWMMRLLVLALVICALMWGLTYEQLKSQNKYIQRLEQEVGIAHPSI